MVLDGLRQASDEVELIAYLTEKLHLIPQIYKFVFNLKKILMVNEFPRPESGSTGEILTIWSDISDQAVFINYSIPCQSVVHNSELEFYIKRCRSEFVQLKQQANVRFGIVVASIPEEFYWPEKHYHQHWFNPDVTTNHLPLCHNTVKGDFEPVWWFAFTNLVIQDCVLRAVQNDPCKHLLCCGTLPIDITNVRSFGFFPVLSETNQI